MRKPHQAWLWVAVVIVAVVLVGLIDLVLHFRGDGPEPKTPASPSAVVPNQAARDGDLEFELVGVDCGRDVVGAPPLTKTTSGVFCLFAVRVRNLGTEPRTVQANDQWAYSVYTRFLADPLASAYASYNAPDGPRVLLPGEEASAVVFVFDIPRETELTRLELHESAGSPGVTVRLQPFRETPSPS